MHRDDKVLFIQHQDDCPPGYVGERMEQHGAHVEVVRAQEAAQSVPARYRLIVPLGSDDSAFDQTVPYLQGEWDLLEAAVREDVPVFGICFGAQLLSRVLGGNVQRSTTGPEIGWVNVTTSDSSLVESGPWLTWHLDVMVGAPPGAAEIARTRVGTQAFAYGHHLGTQFHPEATLASARSWAHRYRASLEQIGVDHDALLAETQDRYSDARQRAHALTDRVLDRAAEFRATS